MKKVFRPLDLQSVNIHRKEECLHYDSCLDEASLLLWPSFSCEGCPLYSPSNETPICYERAASPLAWEV